MSINSKISLEVEDGEIPLPGELDFGIESQMDLIIHQAEAEEMDDHMGLAADVDREELQLELKKLVWGSLHSRYAFWLLGLLQLVCGMQMNLNPYINVQPPRFPVCEVNDTRRLTTLGGGLAPINIANVLSIQPSNEAIDDSICDPLKPLSEFDCTTEYMYYFDGTSVVESFNIPSATCEPNPLSNVWITKNSLFIGFAIGAWLSGILMDRIGRKKTVTLSLLLYLIMCPTAVLAPNMYLFALARFFTGIFMSGMSIGSLILSCELTNRRNRRKIMGLYVVSFGLGAVLTAIIGTVLMDWKMLVLITTVPAFLLLLWQSCVQFNVESPRYYLARGEDVVAMDIYRTIAEYNGYGLQEKMSNINENNIREFVDALFDDIDEEIDDLTPKGLDHGDDLTYSPKSDNFLFTPKAYNVSSSSDDPDKWYQILLAWPCSVWMWAAMFLYLSVESLNQGVNLDLVSYETAYQHFAKTTGMDPDAYLFIGGTDIVPVESEEELMDEFRVIQAIHHMEGDDVEGDIFADTQADNTDQYEVEDVNEVEFVNNIPESVELEVTRRLEDKKFPFSDKLRGKRNGEPPEDPSPDSMQFLDQETKEHGFIQPPYLSQQDQMLMLSRSPYALSAAPPSGPPPAASYNAPNEEGGIVTPLSYPYNPLASSDEVYTDESLTDRGRSERQSMPHVNPDLSADPVSDAKGEEVNFFNKAVAPGYIDDNDIYEAVAPGYIDVNDIDENDGDDSIIDESLPLDNNGVAIDTQSWSGRINESIKWMHGAAMKTYEGKVAELQVYSQDFISGAFEKLKTLLDPAHPLADHYALVRRYSWALISVTCIELLFQMFAIWFCGWNVLGRKAVVAGWSFTAGVMLICCGLLRLPFAIAQVPVLYYGRFLHFLEIFSRFLIVGAITVLQLYIIELFPTSVSGSTYGLITMVIGIIPLSSPTVYTFINSLIPGGYMMVFGGISIFASMVLIATTPDTLTRPTFSTLKHLRSTAIDDPYLNSTMAPCRYCCYDLAYKLCCCCYKNNEHTATYRDLMSKKKLKRIALLMVLEGKKEMKDVYKKTRREVSKLIRSSPTEPVEERMRID